jgi:hypothetical protein
MPTPEIDPVVRWPFVDDTAPVTDHDLAVDRTDVALEDVAGVAGAAFDGTSSEIVVADHPALRFGTGDLSATTWLHTAPETDVVGTLLSAFDPEARTGWHLYVLTNDGVTSTALANDRQLSFGIDDGVDDASWRDCGRPGEAVKVNALSVVDDILYAGTVEAGSDGCGRLFRYGGGGRWVDLGNPIGCNCVASVTGFEGDVYCAVGRYKLMGSNLGKTSNDTPGGQVFKVESDGTWTPRGHPGAEDATPEHVDVEGYHTGKADYTSALTTHRGDLFCISKYRENVFRYEGETSWTNIGLDSRVMSLASYRGDLYALSNGGPVFRYDGGDRWTNCGRPGESDQTYGAAIVDGDLLVGTWPDGAVHRYEGEREWTTLGRLGYEREVMGMVFYNGALYAGSLPMAHVWRLGEDTFDLVGTLDEAPVALRRVWSMATYDGRLYRGTLPGGRVHSFGAGRLVTWDRRLPGGWHHVAAVRDGRRLRLHIDGEVVAISAGHEPADLDIDGGEPLRIGAGATDHLHGHLRDLRLYDRALDREEITFLADQTPG